LSDHLTGVFRPSFSDTQLRLSSPGPKTRCPCISRRRGASVLSASRCRGSEIRLFEHLLIQRCPFQGALTIMHSTCPTGNAIIGLDPGAVLKSAPVGVKSSRELSDFHAGGRLNLPGGRPGSFSTMRAVIQRETRGARNQIISYLLRLRSSTSTLSMRG
jgi:hypothetical protein